LSGNIKKYIQPGAILSGTGICEFNVWAPGRKHVHLHIVGPHDFHSELRRVAGGYFLGQLENIGAGTLYYLRLDDELERPDPASRFQPAGVHGPSQVISTIYAWSDQGWQGIPIEQYIFYELHVGTFSREGTFKAVIAQLEYFKHLGITAIELMPIAQFPGCRNWGYDGVFPYAVQNSYGGPSGLQELVDECHKNGLAVVLDVVYNHLGPEGNYLRDFAPYFTSKYETPWGEAVNYDGPYSDGVRNYFIQNALYWVNDFHIDALRLDAVHAIFDCSPLNILEELTAAVHGLGEKLNRKIHVIAESNSNDVRLIKPRKSGGYGLDAVWNDDFHHSLHMVLTKEKTGYYMDYGKRHQLEKTFAEGFIYSGQYATFWKRSRGTSSRRAAPSKLVVFSQNHDQVGNRMYGERLSKLVSFEALKLAASTVLLSPFLPLIFMGEEYGEEAPFLYFIDHSDSKLIEAVRKGRREEFAAFKWKTEPPDPASASTMLKSTLNMPSAQLLRHREMLEYYRRLISLRRNVPALSNLSKRHMLVSDNADGLLHIRRWLGESCVTLYFNFGQHTVPLDSAIFSRGWYALIDSEDKRWRGKGTLIKADKSSIVVQAAVQPLSMLMLGNKFME